MKKIFVLGMAVLMVVGFASVSMAAIKGSDHDFSGSGWSGGKICIVCHTPHNADITVADAPLWNHALTAVNDYTVYNSITLDAVPGQPSGASKLCLSCHDGTVAIDSYAGQTGGIKMLVGEDAYIGTDLSDDHPISFTYDDLLAGADGGLYPPTTTSSTLGGTIDDDLLFGGKVQCSSCHDVHDAAGNPKLVRIVNDGSALCLICHDK